MRRGLGRQVDELRILRACERRGELVLVRTKRVDIARRDTVGIGRRRARRAGLGHREGDLPVRRRVPAVLQLRGDLGGRRVSAHELDRVEAPDRQDDRGIEPRQPGRGALAGNRKLAQYVFVSVDVLARVGAAGGVDLVQLRAFPVPVDVRRHDPLDVQHRGHGVGALDGIEVLRHLRNRVGHRLTAVDQHAHGLAPVLHLQHRGRRARRVPGRRQHPEGLAADAHLAHREVGRIDGDRGVRLASGICRTEVRTRAQVVEQPLGAAVMVAVAVGEEDAPSAGKTRSGPASAWRGS